MAIDLERKTLVITGASSGIGAATAVEAAKAGMDLVLNARRQAKLEGVAEEIRRLGRRAEIVTGDVAESGFSERLLDATEERLGSFYAVFANAGYGLDVAALDLDEADLRRIFEVNFFASVELVREAAKRLIAREQPGHLLMCSSAVSKFTLPNHSAYSATKAAQNHVCRAMRIELAPHRIEVASVHPITTTTEFFEVSQNLSGGEGRPGQLPDHAPKMFVQPPERVARAVVRCLRKPVPEVWTSVIVRATAAAMTMFPSMFDRVMRKR